MRGKEPRRKAVGGAKGWQLASMDPAEKGDRTVAPDREEEEHRMFNPDIDELCVLGD